MKKQQGFTHVLLLIILVIGLILGVYLVTHPQIFKSKASNGVIVFKDINGGSLPQNNNDIPYIISPTVRVELTSTLGPPANKIMPTTSAAVKGISTPITCNQVTLKASPTTVGTNQKINFSISGDASTYVGDDFGNGTINCSGDWTVNGPGLTCTASSQPGSYTWAHTWKHCEGSFNNCSDTCSQTMAFSVATAEPTSTSPNCQPRPGCLDSNPPCLPPVPIGGWCPTPIPTSSASPIPTATTAPITTVAYRLAENPTDLNNAPQTPYLSEPTTITYTFKDSTPGQKFIWVEFIASNGLTDRKSAEVDIIAPTPSPSSSPTSSFSVGTNITGITHYGYQDKKPYCTASTGYAVGGGTTTSPTSAGGANLYIDPASISSSTKVTVVATADSNCSGNLNVSYGTGLTNCRGGCGDGGTTDGCTCGGNNPKDGKACWWRWTCDAATTGSYTATFNSLFMNIPGSYTDANLAEMQRLGMRVVRVFAANKYIDDNEAAKRLGLFLDKANTYGISAIVSLVDYYNSGYNPQSLDQYYTGSWNGIGLLGHTFFDTGYKTRYKDFVTTVVTANKDKSNIYAWEPGNELTDGSNPSTFLAFMQDIASLIKSIDPKHQIAAGIQNTNNVGSSAQSFYSQLPNVDIVTVHSYDGDHSGNNDATWAKNNNKITSLEEFGYSGTSGRASSVSNELNYWKNLGISTALQWGFIAKGLTNNGDGGDNRYGMDTISHTDYDSLASLYQSFNKTSASSPTPTLTPTCTPQDCTPPPFCRYEGGRSCTCGQLVCSTPPTPPHFSPPPTPISTPVPGRPTCNQVALKVSPLSIGTNQKINFSITGDASTYIGDNFGGGAVNCNGDWTVNGPGLFCTASSKGGDYTWTHTWKHCSGSFSNCSDTCSQTMAFSVLNKEVPPVTPSPTPSPITCTLSQFASAFNSSKGNNKYVAACDTNNDGVINIFDIFSLLQNQP